MAEKLCSADLDEDLWTRARSAAVLQKTLMKDWLADAIKEKLGEKPRECAKDQKEAVSA